MTESPSSKIAKRVRQRAAFWRAFLASGCVSPFREAFTPEELGQLRSFCLFLGYPRSGSTLLASMLTSHPDVLLGHELDVVGFVRWHASRNQLFHAIRASFDEFEKAGRRWEGYDYRIGTPGADGYRNLAVIGDKEAALSTVRIGRDFSLVERTAETVAIPLKLVHVVRNPFDNIATMYLRGRYPILRLPLAACIGDFARMAQTVERVKSGNRQGDVFELHFETLVERPRESLERLCSFLALDPEGDHLDAAAAIVQAPKPSRDRVAWSTSDVRAVEAIIESSRAHHVYSGSRPDRVDTSVTVRAGRPRHAPNFLVVGAQRAGTTLLHRMLALHPEVYLPQLRKEIHFFDQHYARGESWYREFFPVDRDGFTALGEVTPSYFSDPDVPARIRKLDPDMRLMALLRDPVARIWSAYHHLRRVSGETRSFSDFIRSDDDALMRGNYAVQLARYLEFFSSEQILILLFEDFVSTPNVELEKVRQFLALRGTWEAHALSLADPDNRGFALKHARVYRGLRATAHVLTDRVGLGGTVSRLKRSQAMKLFDAGPVGGEMAAVDLRYLASYYAPDVARLRHEFDLDTTVWARAAERSPDAHGHALADA